jgi:hypothetical protein
MRPDVIPEPICSAIRRDQEKADQGKNYRHDRCRIVAARLPAQDLSRYYEATLGDARLGCDNRIGGKGAAIFPSCFSFNKKQGGQEAERYPDHGHPCCAALGRSHTLKFYHVQPGGGSGTIDYLPK